MKKAGITSRKSGFTRNCKNSKVKNRKENPDIKFFINYKDQENTIMAIGKKMCKEGHLMDPSWDICPVCLAPIKGWLVVLNGKEKNKVYTLHEGKTKVGSGSDCEVRILIETISRQHALLIAKGGNYTIQDMNSVTGTFVNGYQINSRDIIDGDLIRLGDVEFKFKCL